VRRRGSALSICAQLTDTVGAAHLWTERATIEQDELGSALDGVSRRIALTLARQLAIVEGIRAELVGENDSAALLARGKAINHQALTREASHTARCFFERALAVDDTSVEATVCLGLNLARALLERWSTAQAGDEARADELLERARFVAPREPLALWGTGLLLCWQGRLDEAISVLRWASELNPTQPDICFQLGAALMYRGRPAEGLRCIEQSIDMDPSASNVAVGFWALGACHQTMGHTREALDWLLRARLRSPDLAFVRLRLAAAFGLIGEFEEARRELYAACAAGNYTTLAAYAAERQQSSPDYRAQCGRTFHAGLRAAGMAEW
jgi:tetratricopeptide (TPR) repeat protein